MPAQALPDDHTTLFDPATVEPPRCTCGSIDPATCHHQWLIANDKAEPYARRPKGCLRAIDPTTAPFPEGF